MTNTELAFATLLILVAALIYLQIRSQRKKGKSWREIAEEYAEQLDPFDIFRRRKTRRKDDDEDSPSSHDSDGPGADLGD